MIKINGIKQFLLLEENNICWQQVEKTENGYIATFARNFNSSVDEVWGTLIKKMINCSNGCPI